MPARTQEASDFQASMAAMRNHWWYRGRRILAASLLKRAGVERARRVLDYGCGTGHMGSVLARFGPVTGVDACAEAIQEGLFEDYRSVVRADTPSDSEVPQGPYDLISCLDVLEHVGDDVGLLRSLGELLGEDGRILLSVPMAPDLFGEMDRMAGHTRRYSRDSLMRVTQAAGLKPVARSGYVTILYPIARWQRKRIRKNPGLGMQEFTIPSALVNAGLFLIAAIEGSITRLVALPPGLSEFQVLEAMPHSGSKEDER